MKTIPVKRKEVRRFLLLPFVIFLGVGGAFWVQDRDWGQSRSPANSISASQAYANRHREILTAFGKKMQRIAARPVPRLPLHATRSQRREILARALDPIPEAANTALQQCQSLTPPSEMQEIHKATIDLLKTFRDTNTAQIAAVRRGDKKQADALDTIIRAKTTTAMERLRDAVASQARREGMTEVQVAEVTQNIRLQ